MSPIPYGFQPINTADAVHDAPLWRDGSSSETRYSGEILITLTALTPLIVGSHQHKVDDKHSQLVPQMLDDGRVLLAGSSLKGMLRSALASLLQAPMERVAERHYTYRPNIAGSGKNKEVQAAIVLECSSSGSLKVALLDSKEVVFLPQNIWKALKEPIAGDKFDRVCRGLKFVEDKSSRYRKKLDVARGHDEKQDRNAKITLTHTVLRYTGGIDGEGLFAKAFHEDKQTYNYVLYPSDKLQQAYRNPISISSAVVRHYEKTQQILANEKIGHLTSVHPLAAKINKKVTRETIDRNKALNRSQLIYVEYDKISKQITSFGHHYQYRWAYTSSTLNKANKRRLEVDWTPEESKKSEIGQPEHLAANRLLFGYALDDKDDLLATGNFKRLAGRITFNTAIEDITNKSEEERFMEGGKEIQLRVLGTPRPSAVEFYLKQTALPKKLITYGDLPNEPGGDLAGRKFYRHQHDAEKNKECYAASLEKGQRNKKTEERGTCVRYLSRPDSRFRTTLRFDSLRPWELGALLVALNPCYSEGWFGSNCYPAGYAHKLGYGKPLGLGSVRLTLDAARWQVNDDWCWQQAYSSEPVWEAWVQVSLAAFKEKLSAAWGERAKEHLDTWLKARRWLEYGYASYPTADREGKLTIFGFHTDLRRTYAAVRRGNNKKDFTKLKELLELKP